MSSLTWAAACEQFIVSPRALYFAARSASLRKLAWIAHQSTTLRIASMAEITPPSHNPTTPRPGIGARDVNSSVPAIARVRAR